MVNIFLNLVNYVILIVSALAPSKYNGVLYQVTSAGVVSTLKTTTASTFAVKYFSTVIMDLLEY